MTFTRCFYCDEELCDHELEHYQGKPACESCIWEQEAEKEMKK